MYNIIHIQCHVSLQNRYVVDASGYFHFYGCFTTRSHVRLVVDNPIYLLYTPYPVGTHTCFSRKSDCLGCAVLLCLVRLTLLASFFLPSVISH